MTKSHAKPTRTLEPAPKGMTLYRISDGKIQTGREADGSLRAVPELIGTVERIGVFRGRLDNGDPYAKIECDLRLRGDQDGGKDGELVSLSANPTGVAGFTFGLILETCEEGETLRFRANKSSKPNKRGTYSTYANADVDKGGTWMQIRVDDDSDLPFDQKCDALEERLASHPLWAERPDRSNAAAPWDALREALEGTAWPAFDDAIAVYAEMAAKMPGQTEEEKYGKLAASVRAKPNDCPPKLLPFVKTKPAEGGDEDEYDPFQDA